MHKINSSYDIYFFNSYLSNKINILIDFKKYCWNIYLMKKYRKNIISLHY